MLEKTQGQRTQLPQHSGSLGIKTTCKVNVVFVRSDCCMMGTTLQSISSIFKRRIVKSCSTPRKVQIVFSFLVADGKKISSKRTNCFNVN